LQATLKASGGRGADGAGERWATPSIAARTEAAAERARELCAAAVPPQTPGLDDAPTPAPGTDYRVRRLQVRC